METETLLPLVCIVDDDDTDRMIAQRALRRIGVRNPVRTFAGAIDFMRYMEATLAEAPPDGRIPVCVAFVDLRMPPPDGFELLRWIRRQPKLSHLQVVILTGSVDPQDMRRAAELRADLYLPKFPSDETLARLVAEASASVLQAIRIAKLQ
ncbi:MAG TPA: response regulator [Opitutaceae bacterium]|nr:response regulator [Opitutaceae bacterium]